MNLQSLRQRIEQSKGAKQQINKDLIVTQQKIKGLQQDIACSKKAQTIILAVAQTTQDEITYRITTPVSLALAAVYDQPYQFIAQFKLHGRGGTECHLGFKRDNVINDSYSVGGGVIDIASFALRLSSLSLQQPHPARLLILDEPAKWIGRDKLPLVGQMLRDTAKQLDLQIIMITHIAELMPFADKTFKVSINTGRSSIKEILT